MGALGVKGSPGSGAAAGRSRRGAAAPRGGRGPRADPRFSWVGLHGRGPWEKTAEGNSRGQGVC